MTREKKGNLCQTSAAVLLVANLFHLIDVLALELSLNRDMAHGRGRKEAAPVLWLFWSSRGKAELHTGGGAARRVAVTLSQTMRGLEARLGVRLLNPDDTPRVTNRGRQAPAWHRVARAKDCAPDARMAVVGAPAYFAGSNPARLDRARVH